MELLLVRHGLPVRIDAGPGPADPSLAEAGNDQATRLARWLAGGPGGEVGAIFTSPLRRAAETAAPLAEATGLPPVIDDRLAEFDRDAATYVPIEDLRADPERFAAFIEAWTSPESLARQEGFRRGVIAALDEIAGGHRGQRVAVVCHGGVINAAAADALGTDRWLLFEPAYTSISRLWSGDDGRRQIGSLNETAHLQLPLA